MEHRRYKRIKNDFDVNINVIKDNESKLDHGKTVNISACGVLINYNKPVDVGSNINIKFFNKNTNETFESIAKVIRVELSTDNNSYEIGIDFIDLNEDNEKKLNSYLEQEENKNENCYYIEIEIPEELLIKQNKEN